MMRKKHLQILKLHYRSKIAIKNTQDAIRLSFILWTLLFIARGFVFIGTILIGWNPQLRADDPLDLLLFPILVLITAIMMMLGLHGESVAVSRNDPGLLDVSKQENDQIKDANKIATISMTRINALHAAIFGLGTYLFLIGHSMHWTANFLNFSATIERIHVSNPHFYSELWFFDEILGHWLLFSGFWLIILSIILMNLRFPSKLLMTRKEITTWCILALVGSIGWVFTSIEGAYATWGLLISGMSVFLIVLFFIKKVSRLKASLSMTERSHGLTLRCFSEYKFLFFIMIFTGCSFVLHVAYLIFFGGKFIQPSELGLFDMLRELIRNLLMFRNV